MCSTLIRRGRWPLSSSTCVHKRWLALSPRQQASLEDALWQKLSNVRPPAINGSAPVPIAIQKVQVDDKSVKVYVGIPTSASPSVAKLIAAVKTAAQEHLASSAPSEALDLHVTVQPWRHSSQRLAKAGKCLEHVGSVIAVASGKGGVGKSTVAVNLAFSLAARGARVGLLDADIYGPSLPTMVRPESMAVRQSKEGTINALIGPLGVKCMSYGWVARRNDKGERGGAFMRGPMVSQVVQQLVKFTEWGEIDHLVVDLPPGTGDIHISLGQLLPFAGAVHVTTPQALALVDVVKGVDMFASLQVPPMGIVMNMAYFSPEDDPSKVYYPFGGGAGSVSALLQRSGLAEDRDFRLPILPALSAAGDSGVPEVVSNPTGPAARVYDALAAHVAAEAERWMVAEQQAQTEAQQAQAAATATAGSAGQSTAVQGTAASSQPMSVSADMGNGRRVTLSYSPARGLSLRSLSDSGASDTAMSPPAVRRACKCAACVDEMSGAQRLRPESVPDSVVPTSLTAAGNYGVAVTWSDGHATSIYTFDQLDQLANGTAKGRTE